MKPSLSPTFDVWVCWSQKNRSPKSKVKSRGTSYHGISIQECKYKHLQYVCVCVHALIFGTCLTGYACRQWCWLSVILYIQAMPKRVSIMMLIMMVLEILSMSMTHSYNDHSYHSHCDDHAIIVIDCYILSLWLQLLFVIFICYTWLYDEPSSYIFVYS